MKLTGKTKKGKNVVQRDGDIWAILARHSSVQCFDGKPGLLVAPVVAGKINESKSRWIEPNNDKHFVTGG